MVRGLANAGLWLFTALMRIIETTDVAESVDVAGGMYAANGSRPRHCDLELQNVTFAYGRRAEPVIRGLDLVVPDGDHLAIIGPSGVGKSTLAGLACGLLTPQQGQVTIAGVALRDRDPAMLAALRVLIPQQAYVFAGSVRENLSYLRPGATDAELDRAVAELGVASLLQQLGGYDADLRPSELSAGERQLVTLTRAYLSPARLVVLDEATCHLDPETEARIERAFARRPGALIVIAHRISSADRARRILLLDGDRVLLGAHDDLLERSALYRDLVGHWQPAPRECRVAS
jgi:ATP-binding cassette subfamily C protein